MQGTDGDAFCADDNSESRQDKALGLAVAVKGDGSTQFVNKVGTATQAVKAFLKRNDISSEEG
jgi:hypothetical protein